MLGSPRSFDAYRAASPRSPVLGRLVAMLALLGTAPLLLPACVTVPPAEKEFLAEPAMTFGSEGRTATHAQHVYANREGSYGARGVGGGGCGCN